MLNNYLVVSKQRAPHPNTEFRVEKHANTNYCRPFAESQLSAFQLASSWLNEQAKPIVLDSGCGTGDSTFFLARRFPKCAVVGIDRSEHRLSKAKMKQSDHGLTNVIFVRARLEDFWRLAKNAKWDIEHHFIFYPNPCPKPEDHGQRWHGHPVFPQLLQLSRNLELRSNWLLYLQEFSIAARVLCGQTQIPQLIENPEGLSAFEKKYKETQNPCYVLRFSDLRSSHT